MWADIGILVGILLCQAATCYWAFHMSVGNNRARVGFAAFTAIGVGLAVWGGFRSGRASDALNNNIAGIKTSLPTASTISQQVVQNETNAHLHLYLYINKFTVSGSAAITLVGSNPGNAAIEINRIEASSADMSDDENNVGFQRVLQPGSSDSKFILAPKPTDGAPGLTVEVLYKGVEQGKPLNLLDICRFNVNKISPLKLEIDPIECQESPGDKFIQTEESQEKAVTFNTADKPEGTLEFVLPEVTPNGSPNVVSFSTASKFFVFNPIKDFAVFVCADGLGAPKILTEKFNENPFGNHNHIVWIIWNDKTGETSLEVDGKTKTVY